VENGEYMIVVDTRNGPGGPFTLTSQFTPDP
jgi:hypothetical protein